jgi:polysaccharide export outer membrane protein
VKNKLMSQRTSCTFITLVTAAALSWCAETSATKSYVLGPDDQISMHVLNVDEIGPQPIRIDMQGNINIALAGRIHAGGLTVEQLENEIAKRFKSYLLNPTVSVTIMEYHSQPISILGAVNRPGIHQLQGHKNLFEALSLAEGLRTDAGDEIRITRRKEWGPIPLQGAITDPSGEYSVASVSIKSIMEATNPKENIAMKPNDVVSVPKAKMVYVVGSVRRPGGFVLSEKATLSVLQAVSLAEGLDRTAASHKAVILRSATPTVQRAEVPIDLGRILSGKSNDLPLQANDILFVPNNMAKSIALRTAEALIQTGTGMAVYK